MSFVPVPHPVDFCVCLLFLCVSISLSFACLLLCLLVSLCLSVQLCVSVCAPFFLQVCLYLVYLFFNSLSHPVCVWWGKSETQRERVCMCGGGIENKKEQDQAGKSKHPSLCLHFRLFISLSAWVSLCLCECLSRCISI